MVGKSAVRYISSFIPYVQKFLENTDEQQKIPQMRDKISGTRNQNFLKHILLLLLWFNPKYAKILAAATGFERLPV